MVCGPRATAIRDVASATGDVGWSIASCQSTFGRSALKLLFGVSVYSFGGELPSGRPPQPARVRARPQPATLRRREIGRASCRESECQDVWISVVAVSLKKQKTKTN